MEIRLLDIVGPAGNEAVELLCVFLAGDRAAGNLGQSQFPAGGQTGVQQGLQCAAAGIKDHLPRLRGGNDLCLAVEPQIIIVEQFFQDLRPRRAGSDPAAPDLLAQFFLLDQLAGIFHSQDHASGGIALGRRSLSFPDGKRTRQDFCPLSGGLEKLRDPDVFTVLFRAGISGLFRPCVIRFSGVPPPVRIN